MSSTDIVAGNTAAPSLAGFLTDSLTSEEQEIVKEFMTTQKTPFELVPQGIDSEKLWKMLSATCKSLRRTAEAVSKLKPFLGQMFIELRNHPDLITSQGYANYTQFMTDGVSAVFGVSRSEAFACTRVAEEFGGRLTPDEMWGIGFSKLAIASTAVRKIEDGIPPEKREEAVKYWIDAAKTDTVVQLQERMASRQLIEPGQLDMAALTIMASKPIVERWRKFKRDADIRAYVGADSDGMILDAMMAECSVEWKAQAKEATARAAVTEAEPDSDPF